MARIAILVEKIYEDLELQYPRLRLNEAGHTVEVIGPKAWETYVGKHGYPQKAEKSAADAGKTSERTLPADKYQYDDDGPGERGGSGWGAKFPHPLGEPGDALEVKIAQDARLGDAERALARMRAHDRELAALERGGP